MEKTITSGYMGESINPDELAKMTKIELLEKLGELRKRNKLEAFATLGIKINLDAFNLTSNVDEGTSFFKLLNKNAYDFFCGGCGEVNDDGTKTEDCLEHIKKALGITTGTDAIITALTGLLVASLGLAAIIAGIIAAILINFIFPTILNELCKVWHHSVKMA